MISKCLLNHHLVSSLASQILFCATFFHQISYTNVTNIQMKCYGNKYPVNICITVILSYTKDVHIYSFILYFYVSTNLLKSFHSTTVPKVPLPNILPNSSKHTQSYQKQFRTHAVIYHKPKIKI